MHNRNPRAKRGLPPFASSILAVWVASIAWNVQSASAEGTTIKDLIFQPSMNIVISTSDVAKTKEFYGEVLGLEPMDPLIFPNGMEMTRYRVGTSEIKFLHNPQEIPRETGGVRDAIGIRLLAFFFPDEAALAARFEASGRRTPKFGPVSDSGARVGFANDPDGNLIELIVMPEGTSDDAFDRLDIGLTVSDTEAARKFYGKFLGLDEVEPREVEALGGMLYAFMHGTTKIKFWSFGSDLPKYVGHWDTAYGLRLIQYIVTDLDAVDAHARSEGAMIDTPIFELGDLARIMFIADPDGIINEFVGGPKP